MDKERNADRAVLDQSISFEEHKQTKSAIKKKEIVFPIIIFISALIVRLTYNFTIALNYQPIYDAGIYDTIARNIVDYHCYCLSSHHSSMIYPTVSRPPLWPFIIATIYFFADKENIYARLFYCLLGSGTCILIYLFVRDLFSHRIALISGIIAVLYAGLFIYDGWLYSESLYTFCGLSFIYALYRLQQASSLTKRPATKKWLVRLQQEIARQRWAILCGILLGLTALARPNGILLLGLLAVWALLIVLTKVLPWQVVLKHLFIITCITAAIIAPWTYRNYQLTHRFVLVSTGMGEVLIGSYNDSVVSGDPAHRGRWAPPPGTRIHDTLGYTPDDDKAQTAQAFKWIGNHLNLMPYLFSLHFINMWIPYSYAHGLPFEQPSGQAGAQIMIPMIQSTTILIIFFALIGFFATWRRKKTQLLVIHLFLILTILQNVIFYSDMRFRAPIEPFLVILAGGAFWRLASKIYSHRNLLL